MILRFVKMDRFDRRGPFPRTRLHICFPNELQLSGDSWRHCQCLNAVIYYGNGRDIRVSPEKTMTSQLAFAQYDGELQFDR